MKFIVYALFLMLIIVMGNYASAYDIAFVGDIGSDQESLDVRDAIYRMQPDLVVCLGDMTYSNNFTWFEQHYLAYWIFPNIACVIGNHDLEYKNQSIAAQANELFSEYWVQKISDKLFIGLNTDGNLNQFYKQAKETLEDENIMANITQVFLVTHRPCEDDMSPTLTEFCQGFEKLIPIGVEYIQIAGHHHVLSISKVNGTKIYVSGGGGAFHQKCSKPIYYFCNDVDFGFLMLHIHDSTNQIKPIFYDINGKVLFKEKIRYNDN